MRRKRHDQLGTVDDPDLPKYSIAVAADISGVPQQQLRRMEESGLISPQRSQGNTRRYSDNDLRQIGTISELADDGINAAGVRLVLELRAEVAALRAEVDSLRRRVVTLTDALPGARATADQHLAQPGQSKPAPRVPRTRMRASSDEVSPDER